MRNFYLKFVLDKWNANARLQQATLAEQGLMLHVLCIMAKSPRVGFLLNADGTVMTRQQLATRMPPRLRKRQLSKMIDNLMSSGVLKVDPETGAFYSRFTAETMKSSRGGSSVRKADRSEERTVVAQLSSQSDRKSSSKRSSKFTPSKNSTAGNQSSSNPPQSGSLNSDCGLLSVDCDSSFDSDSSQKGESEGGRLLHADGRRTSARGRKSEMTPAREVVLDVEAKWGPVLTEAQIRDRLNGQAQAIRNEAARASNPVALDELRDPTEDRTAVARAPEPSHGPPRRKPEGRLDLSHLPARDERSATDEERARADALQRQAALLLQNAGCPPPEPPPPGEWTDDDPTLETALPEPESLPDAPIVEASPEQPEDREVEPQAQPEPEAATVTSLVPRGRANDPFGMRADNLQAARFGPEAVTAESSAAIRSAQGLDDGEVSDGQEFIRRFGEWSHAGPVGPWARIAIDAWNAGHGGQLKTEPPPGRLTRSRDRQLHAALAETCIMPEEMRWVALGLTKSKWHRGENDKGFKADLSWIIQRWKRGDMAKFVLLGKAVEAGEYETAEDKRAREIYERRKRFYGNTKLFRQSDD